MQAKRKMIELPYLKVDPIDVNFADLLSYILGVFTEKPYSKALECNVVTFQ